MTNKQIREALKQAQEKLKTTQKSFDKSKNILALIDELADIMKLLNRIN